MKRVVVGINSMGPQEGLAEMALPQHSRAFRRHLKIERVQTLVRKNPDLVRPKLASLSLQRQAPHTTAPMRAAGR